MSAEYDSLVGVRSCGCITAWMSLEGATPAEIFSFHMNMERTGRTVRQTTLAEIANLIGGCQHGGIGEAA